MTNGCPARQQTVDAKKDCNGEKNAMAGHLCSCPHSTADEKELAARIAPTKAEKEMAEKKRERGSSQAQTTQCRGLRGGGGGRRRRDRGGDRDRDSWEAKEEVQVCGSRGKLKAYKGVDMPFSADQKTAIADQFLRATQSANLPERWVEDVEVAKLFMMFRLCAMDVIPSRKQVGGTLLQRASKRVNAEIQNKVCGENVLLNTDGWRSNMKDSVGGVQLNWKFQTLLIDILRTNHWLKDGESLAVHFGGMIDDAKRKLGCNVVAFLTDNDGGSKCGQNLLGEARPWLLVFPCVAHQGQLILGDFLKECPEAAEVAEELIEFVNWLNQHDKVRNIFDEQQKRSGNTLSYIVANLTRWTTHLVAFLRFRVLKIPIRAAILNERDAIIKAQVGAESNRCKAESLRLDAIAHCESVEANSWWDRLDTAIDDIEHICYLTNISQSDQVQPDEFLLALAGLFLHFRDHTNKELGKRMCKRLEKCWKELDQVVLIIALIFNPFQGLSRFGDNANIDAFIVSTALVKPLLPRTDDEQRAFEAALKKRTQALHLAAMLYLSKTGPFATWYAEDSQVQETHLKLHGDDPMPFWEVFKGNTEVAELAKFIQMLLYLVLNQAGLERSFSDFSNKKNKKRARLGLEKIAQQSKVTRAIRREQYEEGLQKKRDMRKNHSNETVKTLLSVPRYADAVLSNTDDEGGGKQSMLVGTKAGWRKEVKKWQAGMEELNDSDSGAGNNSDDDLPANLTVPASRRLFGGKIVNPARIQQQRQAITEESRLMELLAAEYSGEEADASAMEGSGDDYNG
ncbi:ribonuclease H-like domain-containing protein [Mycena amicta]|nr:ribonuclease H-like domain-containing protein [Mycena amicta]